MQISKISVIMEISSRDCLIKISKLITVSKRFPNEKENLIENSLKS